VASSGGANRCGCKRGRQDGRTHRRAGHGARGGGGAFARARVVGADAPIKCQLRSTFFEQPLFAWGITT
jgi:hypothetical protein